MSLSLMDFEGDWRLKRVIEDRLAGQGVFEGTARFEIDGTGLRYVEEGTLTLGSARRMHAERSYIWQLGPDGLIEVFFDDGRPFHRFDPAQSGAGDRHLCDPDIYDVVYDFDTWPNWSSTWTVQGPRKDYVMRTSFVRLE